MSKLKPFFVSILVWVWAATVPAAEIIRPQIGTPLRDAAVARAADPSGDGTGGVYYLTGTTAINTLEPRFQDFQNNDGVRLWKSADLANWEPVGLVWNLAEGQAKGGARGGARWQQHLRAVPGEPERHWSHGATSPELHRLGKDWWIVFAMNDSSIGMLKSASGKPEGPYEEWTFTGSVRIDNRLRAGYPSLFQAVDGAAWMIWADGLVARFAEDMQSWAEPPVDVHTRIAEGGIPYVHPRGHTLFEHQGKTYLVFSAHALVDGKTAEATLVCVGDSPTGPFSAPSLFGVGLGEVTFAEDGKGGRMAVYADGRPAIRPVTWQGQPALPTIP